MSETPNHDYNVPQPGEQNWHEPLNDNFESLDADVEIRDAGDPTAAGYDDPAENAKYLDTETGEIYIAPDGSWESLGVIGEDGGIESLSGGDGIDPADIGDGDELSVAWADAEDLGSAGEIDDWSGATDLDAAGALTATVIHGLVGGDGIDPADIGDGDELSVAWADANDLDEDGNVDADIGGESSWEETDEDHLSPVSDLPQDIDVGDVHSDTLVNEAGEVTVRGGPGEGVVIETDDGVRTLRLGPPMEDNSGLEGGGNVLAGHPHNEIDDAVGAVIAGGGREDAENVVSGNYGVVVGGILNTASGRRANVAGGRNNTASGFRASIGGGGNNTATERDATVAGGESNDSLEEYAAVGGGFSNEAAGDTATVAGGSHNDALGNSSTVGGGSSNDALGENSTVSGGLSNEADDEFATVGGGQNNQATGRYATIAGGGGIVDPMHPDWQLLNIASGDWSTVPGGRANEAAGDFTFAAGQRAKALHDGAVVIGDSSDIEVESQAQDEVRLQGELTLDRADYSPSVPGTIIQTTQPPVAEPGTEWQRFDDPGTQIWEHTHHGSVDVNAVFERDGVVYSGASDGTVIAADTADGEELWTHSHHSDSVTGMFVLNGVVYTSSEDGTVVGADVENGDDIWGHDHHDGAVQDLYASRNHVYSCSSDGSVIATRIEDETVNWQNTDSFDDPLRSLVEQDGYLYVTEGSVYNRSAYYKIDPEDDVIWSRIGPLEGGPYPIFARDGIAYLGSIESLLANNADGIRWSIYRPSITVNDIFVRNDIVYSGWDDGEIIATDKHSSTELWRHDYHPGEVNSVTERDGVLYSASQDGSVMAVVSEPATYVSDGEEWLFESRLGSDRPS